MWLPMWMLANRSGLEGPPWPMDQPICQPALNQATVFEDEDLFVDL